NAPRDEHARPARRSADLVVKEALSGQQCDVRAQVVINATGAWVDELRGQLQQAPKIRPARGSHIVVAAERLPVTMAFTILHRDRSEEHTSELQSREKRVC